jgi:SAM-dependent methyltransferase
MQDNQQQVEYWNGIVGERWMSYQSAIDRNLGPLGEAAMHAANILPGARVLDVGCGCGDTTLALADRVGPQGWVTGVDISAPMLDRARQRLGQRPPGGAVVELQQADASTAPLPDDVDLIFSRFGVMFFADPTRAFAHLAEALRPGGDLAFVCWRSRDENQWATVPVNAVKAHLPPEPPSDPLAPGPFAFADPDRIRKILSPSFSEVSVTPHDLRLAWTRTPSLDEAVDFFLHIGPSARSILEAPPQARERCVQALSEALGPYITPDGLMFSTATWIVTARR